MSTSFRILLPALFLLHVLVLFPFLSVNVIADHHHSNGKRGCMDKERQALLKFKNGVADPNRTLSSWVGGNCCRWFGVVCHNVTGHVVELSLSSTYGFDDSPYTWLSGRIDSSLGDLTHLVHLDLSFNDFDPTPIPIFLGNSFPHLRYLNLSHAGFVDDVPPHMGNLSNLRVLDLRGNRDMTIGNISWFSHLSSLQYLDLSCVTIPEKAPWFEAVNKLSSLRELRLSRCNLENIYASFPRVKFTDLKVLDLSWNNFHRSVLPDWMSHLTNLEQLDVSYNNFTGPIPSYLGRMSALRRLNLRFNKFEGSLPESLGQLSGLVELDISRIALEGPIPSYLGRMSALQILRLGFNNFEGSVPESLGQLSDLVELDISGNALEGNISELHFSKLAKLEFLDMSRNSFKFNISSSWVPPFQLKTLDLLYISMEYFSFPYWLRNQENIDRISMSNANLHGPAPEWFWKILANATYIDLSNNKIRGELPAFSSQLVTLYLSNNSFSGSLPNNWEQDSRLLVLDLSNNGFSGTIPNSFGNLTELEYLILENNDLSGQLSLPPMNNLVVLYLQSNRFLGKIPEWICGNVSNKESVLMFMDLSNNELSGTIPSSFGNLTNLVSLYLGNNTLSGQLPLSMKNMKNLLLIDLRNNRLSGTIPSWIGENLSNLRFLNLRSNLFHGEVPGHLSRLASLQILDVANNTLSGSIPKSFRNFKAMANSDSYGATLQFLPNVFRESMWIVMKGRESFYEHLWKNKRKDLDLSMNKFSGNIPEELTELKGLHSLNLSGNCLQGPIPDKIGDLRNLESLDLSRNRLSGVIPPTLSALSFLGWFNVSNNNLSGKIPFIGHSMTFENSSYIGNEKLCGPPLSKKCPGDHETLQTHQDPNGHMSQEEEDDEIEPWTLYIVTGSGFIGGICTVLGVLIVNKSWRDMFYRFSDDMFERFIVAVILRRNRIKRMLLK